MGKKTFFCKLLIYLLRSDLFTDTITWLRSIGQKIFVLEIVVECSVIFIHECPFEEHCDNLNIKLIHKKKDYIKCMTCDCFPSNYIL